MQAIFGTCTVWWWWCLWLYFYVVVVAVHGDLLLLLHNRGSILKNVPRNTEFVSLHSRSVRGYEFCPLRDLESQKMSPTIL